MAASHFLLAGEATQARAAATKRGLTLESACSCFLPFHSCSPKAACTFNAAFTQNGACDVSAHEVPISLKTVAK